MKNFLIGWLGIVALVSGAETSARELILEYDAVVHVTNVNAVSPPGAPARRVGVASFKGIAVFDGGRLANHRYAGHFDFKDGAGTFAGYAVWVFADGSTLRSAYAGEARVSGRRRYRVFRSTP